MVTLRFFLTLFALCVALRADSRPNILWITCEDTTPHLGSYGDAFAVTPHLDKLARESVRYTQAFAYTGACSPSRSCLITGVYPSSLGTHHMRSTIPLPDGVEPFTKYLREAGYYASNNVKEDYNFQKTAGMWDDSSASAHWRGRAPGQPFFAVFNLMVTHQSQIFASEAAYRTNTRRLTPAQRRDPNKVTIPPIHPDTPEFRKDWARHYENITAMDYQVADILAELEADGLADDTIVFFFSDNGTGMPGIKMWAWGPSLHVPLLIRFPPKWSQAAPAQPGSAIDRLVSFVDFAPTMLSLAGVDLPGYLQGLPFLGSKTGTARDFVFGGKDRQSETTHVIRYARDHRFQYLRNFSPHLSYGQFMSYNWQAESMKAWERLHLEGKLSGPPARFFAPVKPIEELYDVRVDPWQVNNLADDPAYAGELTRMRTELDRHMRATADLGLLPEHEMHLRSQGTTPYQIATDPRLNPLDELLQAAQLANQTDRANLQALTALLDRPDPALRWWGAIGLVSLGQDAAPARTELVKALRDVSPNVRVAAAEALALLGDTAEAFPVLTQSLRNGSVFERLSALNVALRLGSSARPLLPAIADAKIVAPEQKDTADYVNRMVEYLPNRISP